MGIALALEKADSLTVGEDVDSCRMPKELNEGGRPGCVTQALPANPIGKNRPGHVHASFPEKAGTPLPKLDKCPFKSFQVDCKIVGSLTGDGKFQSATFWVAILATKFVSSPGSTF